MNVVGRARPASIGRDSRWLAPKPTGGMPVFAPIAQMDRAPEF